MSEKKDNKTVKQNDLPVLPESDQVKKVLKEPQVKEVNDGVQGLQGLCNELKDTKLQKTHSGVIVCTQKSTRHPESKKRELVIKTGLNFVYMDEDDAFESLKKIRKGEELLNREVHFRVKEVIDNKLYVSSKLVHESFQKLIKAGTVLKSKVCAIITDDEDQAKEYLVFDWNGNKLYLPRYQIHYIAEKRSLGRFLGKDFQFVVIGFDEQDRILVSSRVILEAKRDQVIKKLENNEILDAKIHQLEAFGARAFIDGVLVVFRNKDFSTDYTKVNTVLSIGDIVKVRLSEISSTYRIFVEPETKYTAPKITGLPDIEEGNLFEGVVSTVTTFGCFVTIRPGIDALCPMPSPEARFTPVAGVNVKIKITRKDENNRVRGAILGVVTHSSVDFDIEDAAEIYKKRGIQIDREQSTEE